MSATATTTKLGGLGVLIEATREACEVLAPLVRSIYLSIDDSTRKEKKDSSLFSIADGLVQHAFVAWLFGGRIRDVVGEESLTGSSAVQLDAAAGVYRVGDMAIPERLWRSIDETQRRFTAIAQRLDAELIEPNAAQACTADDARRIPSSLVDAVFIDPIDGTREFCTGLGQQSTICVGFCQRGRPVAGVVYRPVPDPPTWAAGAAAESIAASFLPDRRAAPAPGLLTTNGSISPFLAALMEQLAIPRVPSGGVGNKMLMLLENAGTLYLQDRGVSRWDTCAAQAILEAHGGQLAKLAPFVAAGQLQSYTYARSTHNADFEPGQAAITAYNRATKDIQPGSRADHISQVLPYSNLAGLLAVGAQANTPASFEVVRAAIDALVAKGIQPAYD